MHIHSCISLDLSHAPTLEQSSGYLMRNNNNNNNNVDSGGANFIRV